MLIEDGLEDVCSICMTFALFSYLLQWIYTYHSRHGKLTETINHPGRRYAVRLGRSIKATRVAENSSVSEESYRF